MISWSEQDISKRSCRIGSGDHSEELRHGWYNPTCSSCPSEDHYSSLNRIQFVNDCINRAGYFFFDHGLRLPRSHIRGPFSYEFSYDYFFFFPFPLVNEYQCALVFSSESLVAFPFFAFSPNAFANLAADAGDLNFLCFMLSPQYDSSAISSMMNVIWIKSLAPALYSSTWITSLAYRSRSGRDIVP